MKIRATLAAGVLAASSVAFGIAQLGTVELAAADSGNIDAYKARSAVVDTTAIGTLEAGYETSRAAGMQAVAALEVGEATDMQFQRRTEEVDGVTVTRDLAFVGISDIGGSFDGFTIVDVTDPTNPQTVIDTEDGRMACGGFHNDVAVWQDYLVIGHDGSAGPCDTAPQPSYDPGVTVFDVSDPANPQFLRWFPATAGQSATDSLLSGVHNIAIHPDGIVHYAAASFEVDNPGFGYLDLNGDPADWQNVAFPIRDISPTATDGCHDMGYSFTGETPLMVCPAIGSTLLWDITDPKAPVEVAVIPNPAINIHHGGRFTPDGSTVVLGDELAGAGAPSGCFNGGPVGAMWTYDLTVPEAPVPTGYVSASESPGTIETCTSHFYNFVPNAEETTTVVTGWYGGGMVVHDLTPAVAAPLASGGPVGVGPEIAHLEPTDAEMWNAYAYRGHVFGNSYTGNTGFFVASLDGYTGTADADLAPYCNDVGIVWGPATGDWEQECRNPGDPIAGDGEQAEGELPAQASDNAREARSRRGAPQG